MPVTDTTTFRIFDTSVGAWKNITALSLKNDVADPLDWLIVYDGTTDNQWEKVDPTGFKALTAATDYALAVDTSEKVPGTLLEAYFGGGIPANTWSMDIATADASWTLHTNSTCTVDVDWGDGNSEQLVLAGNTDTTHTYAAPGQYTVTFTLVSGDFRPYWSGAAEGDVVALNGTGAGWTFGANLSSAFQSETNLTSISADMDTSMVSSWINAFYGTSNLASFPLLDMSSAINLTGTWRYGGLTSFSLVDTSSVTNMTYTWWGNSLTTFPLIDTSLVTQMPSAWRENALTSFPAIDTSLVTNLSNTWQSNQLTSFPFINTSLVQTFSMTWVANQLTLFPAIDTSSAASFNRTWDGNPLVVFPLLDMSAGTYFVNAWRNCNLSAASIENITRALIANGRSNLNTTINGTPYSDWTAQAQADYVELTTNRGWTIATS